MKEDTQRLVKLARKGNRQAFTQLVLDHEQMLARVAMTILKNPEDAADAVQDAILDAWQNLGSLRQAKYFKTWLIRILMNKCYRIGSLQSKHSHTQLEELPVASQLPDWDQTMDVNAALESLKEEDRLVLGLFYYDGLSTKEISKALSISEDCVRQRLHRSRKRFQTAYLEKEELCHEK